MVKFRLRSILIRHEVLHASCPRARLGEDRFAGSLLLAEQGDYDVIWATSRSMPQTPSLRIWGCSGHSRVSTFESRRLSIPISRLTRDAIVSSASLFPAIHGSRLALDHRMHYFDLTEDVEVTTRSSS